MLSVVNVGEMFMLDINLCVGCAHVFGWRSLFSLCYVSFVLGGFFEEFLTLAGVRLSCSSIREARWWNGFKMAYKYALSPDTSSTVTET